MGSRGSLFFRLWVYNKIIDKIQREPFLPALVYNKIIDKITCL